MKDKNDTADFEYQDQFIHGQTNSEHLNPKRESHSDKLQRLQSISLEAAAGTIRCESLHMFSKYVKIIINLKNETNVSQIKAFE